MAEALATRPAPVADALRALDSVYLDRHVLVAASRLLDEHAALAASNRRMAFLLRSLALTELDAAAKATALQAVQEAEEILAKVEVQRG